MNLARTIGAGLLTAGMLALVIVLAVLQYQWLGEVSLAERQRLKFAISQSGGAVASDLSVEIGAMVTLLQPAPGEMDSDDWTALAAGYDIWTQGSLEPGLLKDFLLVTRPREGTAEIRQWSIEKRSFDLAAQSTKDFYAPLVSSIANHTDTPDIGDCVLTIVPVFEAGGKAELRPVLILVLDKKVLVEKLIPRIVQSRFGDSNMKDQFVVKIIDFAGDSAKHGTVYPISFATEDQESVPVVAETRIGPGDVGGDFLVPLFSQRVLLSAFSNFFPDKMRLNPNFEKSMIRIWYGRNNVSKNGDEASTEYFFSRSNSIPAGEGQSSIVHKEKSPDVDSESQPGRWQDRIRDTVIINMGGPDQVYMTSDGPGSRQAVGAGGLEMTAQPVGSFGIHADWALSVTHRDGSLSEAVERNRIRNLVVSLGILCLLTTAMIVLFLAGRRASSVAAREREFVASVSHELRTPLAVLRSAGENLTDGIVRAQDRIERYGRLVVQESRRLHGMVEDMLLYAGLQSGHRRVAFQAVDLRTIVNDILQSRADEIAASQTKIELEIPEGFPDIPADSTALRSAIENLVDNALRHGAAGQWLGIRAHNDRKHVYIEIADHGPGIPRGEQSRIFQPFVRGSRAFNNQVPGSGLGLSLVRRIARQHGGNVKLYSRPGKGARFVFRLPIAKYAKNSQR